MRNSFVYNIYLYLSLKVLGQLFLKVIYILYTIRISLYVHFDKFNLSLHY